MALWQVSFSMLPKALVEGFDEVPSVIFNGYGAAPLDDISPLSLPANYAEQVSNLLPSKEGWSKEMELWGDESSDDITIWRDVGKIESIDVRIDVRKLDNALLAGVLSLAENWGCVLVEKRYLKVCRMNLPTFRALICGHPHSRAMTSPKDWLPVLAKEVQKDSDEA